jgi:isopentenyl phosphate kinase
MSERVLLKLGGSVVTEKGVEGVIAGDALPRIAREISLRKHLPLIVVHGAGSCGHPEAHRFSIDKGVKRDNMEGVYQTHRAVSRLNMAVVGALRDAGVEAIGIHPLDACIAEEGRLTSCMHTHLCLMTDIGIMPVLHGDVVMDNSRGACIVSGDQLIRYLAPLLGADRVGLATDVPGVIHEGRVVPEITPASAEKFRIGRSSHTDVTGGMAGKIGELLALAGKGISSDIFHVDRIGDFLDKKPHGGTRITGGSNG